MGSADVEEEPRSWILWCAARMRGVEVVDVEEGRAMEVKGEGVGSGCCNVRTSLPVDASKDSMEPLAVETQISSGDPGVSGVDAAIERIAEVFVELDKVFTISPCRGENIPSVPFENPTATTSSVTPGRPETLFLFFPFPARIISLSSSVSTFSIFASELESSPFHS